jgi:hypothetical protein
LSGFSVFAVANFEFSIAREVAVETGRSSTEQDLGLAFLAVGGTCVDLDFETKVSKALVETGGPELEFGPRAEEHARDVGVIGAGEEETFAGGGCQLQCVGDRG